MKFNGMYRHMSYKLCVYKYIYIYIHKLVGFLPADPDEKSSESEESVVTSPSPETTKPAKDGDVNSEPKPPSKPEPKPKAAVPEVSKNSGPEEPGSRTVAAQKRPLEDARPSRPAAKARASKSGCEAKLECLMWEPVNYKALYEFAARKGIRQLGWWTTCYRLAKRAELMDKLNNRPVTGISQVPVVYSKSRCNCWNFACSAFCLFFRLQ